MAKKSAQGSGSIRQRKDGLWEARYTIGRDPATGKQIRKSVYGKTQQEVRKKMTAANADIDKGIYTEPSKITFSQWLEIWLSEYCGAVKPRTLTLYQNTVKIRVKPFLGQIQLCRLTPVIFQKYYNDSIKGNLKGLDAISAKTVKNVHGIIHKALQKAVELGYLKSNPVSACVLPKAQRKELHPLNEAQTKAFMKALEREPFRRLFLVALFTGIREGELLGLTWEAVNFEDGTIRIFQQLQRHNGKYSFFPPKNNKSRIIAPAPYVMDLLREERKAQTEKRLLAGKLWDNKMNLIFTFEDGRNLTHQWIYKKFKDITADIGIFDVRFHDLRHSYAVAALRMGDDVKTVSENLGHASVAFTLDVYGHVTDEMKKSSAERMQAYITALNA